MNEKLKEFLSGLGVLAETTKASYDAFLAAGFEPTQSLALASEFMKESLRISVALDKNENNPN